MKLLIEGKFYVPLRRNFIQSLIFYISNPLVANS